MAGFAHVGRYRLVRKIATGGMAEVWLATSTGAGGFVKDIVVKRILPHLATDPAFVSMFLNEARLAARLNHPNIVQIFELGDDRGFFMVMEYVPGLALRGVLREHQLRGTHPPFPIAARVIADAATGLHYAHQLTDRQGNVIGLIHRDVSPDNLLLSCAGQVKVADFGIARASTTASHTQDGQLRGKIPYMAPERLAGQPIDRRSDIYALGVVMYEMLTGLRPFGTLSGSELIAQALFSEPPAAVSRRPDIPERLGAIVTRAIAGNPDERYPTAAALAADLEDYLKRDGCSPAEVGAWVREHSPPEPPTQDLPTQVTVSAIPPDGPVPLASPARRPVGVIGGVVLAIVGAATFIVVSRPRVEPTPPVVPLVEVTATPSRVVPSPTLPPPVVPSSSEDAGLSIELPIEPAKEQPPIKRVRVEARAGRLVVRVHPWADVFVDGQPVGLTPLAPVELRAGKHQLKLVNSQLGKSVLRTFTIHAGTATTVEVNLMSEQ